MSITDELREWARNHVAELNIGGVDERDLKEIADRIDEQHRKALERVAAMVDEPDAGWSGCRSCKAHKRGGVVECQAYANMLRLDALERRVSVLERKLNHKGGAE